MLNHIKNSKTSQDKLEEDIADLISEKKKNDELISTLKSKSTDMCKALKSNEKTIYNLEKKNENLVDQVRNAKASKIEEKREKLNLANKLKALKAEKENHRNKITSASTEADPQPQCSSSNLENNNPTTALVSASSISVQVCDESSHLQPTVSKSSPPKKEDFCQEDTGGLAGAFPAADYIKSINQIDLVPRVNDLSKF